MKVIVAGSRGITSVEPVGVAITLSGFTPAITEIVSGTARGVDSNGELWATFHNVNIRRFVPDWEGKGKGAGFARNIDMAEYADALVAVWDGKSHGTLHMIRYMHSLGRPVFVYEPHTPRGYFWPGRPIPTAPMVLSRGQIGQVRGLDITVKSGRGRALEFAPTWEMVWGYQDKTMSVPQYAMIYRTMLGRLPIDAWRWLTSEAVAGELRVLCYCPDTNFDGSPKFCHTNLLIAYMLRRWPQFFQDGRAEKTP